MPVQDVFHLAHFAQLEVKILYIPPKTPAHTPADQTINAPKVHFYSVKPQNMEPPESSAQQVRAEQSGVQTEV